MQYLQKISQILEKGIFSDFMPNLMGVGLLTAKRKFKNFENFLQIYDQYERFLIRI